VTTVRYVSVLVLLCRAAVALAQDDVEEDFHPTDVQVRQIEQTCTVSESGMPALDKKVSAAVIDWTKATAGTAPGSALRQLSGYLEQVRSQSNLSGRKGIYLLCVEKGLRQFVDARREKPTAVVASGSSQALQRMSFASEDEIWHRGCQDAESDAVSKLKQRCGERTFVTTSSECAQASGNVRTYTTQVSGECRGR
jgi:hypothetical protein